MQIRDTVGRFFEQLTAKVLKARPVINGSLDLGIGKALIGLEVKGSNSSNSFRISTEQLDEHLNENLRLFPDMLEELLYCLFCYKNPRIPTSNGDGSRQTTLSCCKDQKEIFEALAKNTDTVFVLDYRVIDAFVKLYGTEHSKLHSAREIQVVCIKRTDLKEFVPYKSKDKFISLGLNPEEWSVRKRYMDVRFRLGDAVHKLKLGIVEVLPKELMVRLYKAIRVPKNRPSQRTITLEVSSEPCDF